MSDSTVQYSTGELLLLLCVLQYGSYCRLRCILYIEVRTSGAFIFLMLWPFSSLDIQSDLLFGLLIVGFSTFF